MTLMPEVHDALARAVATRRQGRRWWQSRRRLGLLALGATIVTGTALAATGAWHPTLGSDDRGHPRPATTAVPGDQSAAISVLRRAQTDADRGPQVKAVLRMLGPDEINGIHTDGIRVLSKRPDGIALLVPVERVGRHDKGYPSSIQRRVLCVMSSSNMGPRTIGSPHGKIRVQTGGPSVGQTCGDVKKLTTTGIGASMPGPHGWRSFAVVPDGVARVVIRLRDHQYVAGRVRNNLYEVDTGDELAPGWGVAWFDAQGHRIDHRVKR